MEIVNTLKQFPPQKIAISIGMFDGFHLGHQLIIKHLKALAKEQNALSCVITYKNHPASVVKDYTIHQICSAEHKISLFKESGIDLLVFLEFNKELASISAKDFLDNIFHQSQIAGIVLGHDAAFGKNRSGTKDFVIEYGKQKNIEVKYLEPLMLNNARVSSTDIRQAILKGELFYINQLLGRPYSIYGKVIKGLGKGKVIGFATANIDLTHLVLPPFGVYAIRACVNNKYFKGIANIGIAPTIRNSKEPFLEVHLFNYEEDLYNSYMNVEFVSQLRNEIKFNSIEELTKQIDLDVKEAKVILESKYGKNL